jgi:hypothetical protein
MKKQRFKQLEKQQRQHLSAILDKLIVLTKGNGYGK